MIFAAGKNLKKDRRMYDSARWRKARRQQLSAEPLCAICERQGRTTPASVVDHIEPHRGDPALFWAPLNRQSLCPACHSGVKRIQENRGHSQAAGEDGMPIDRRHPCFDGQHS